jgi:hypothetical protein
VLVAAAALVMAMAAAVVIAIEQDEATAGPLTEGGRELHAPMP